VQAVGAAVRLFDPRFRLEVARLDLVERGRTPRRGGLNLDLLDHVRGTVDLDDHPALEVLRRYHGRRSSGMRFGALSIAEGPPGGQIKAARRLDRAVDKPTTQG